MKRHPHPTASAMLLVLLWTVPSILSAHENRPDESRLTVRDIYDSAEFRSDEFRGRWTDNSRGFLKTQGQDIIHIDARSGEKEIVVPASLMVPGGEGSPLRIEGYQFSDDQAMVLLYTNSKRVWRRNSRGDYWVLDRSARVLWKLGGEEAKPSTLQFAKFSPDGCRVAYVRERNIYVEDLRTRRIQKLTETPNARIVNGTFDWVYEEEFQIRDGFRWSPDGRSIAFWEIDTSGVPRFTMIDNLGGFYPETIEFEYPKTGQVNPAARIGVVDIHSKGTTWIALPGAPRWNYIARMDWAPVSEGRQELLIQQLGRRQNRLRVFLADPKADAPRLLFTERDDAWVDVHDEIIWLDGGRKFTWISERDGWRHVYIVDRETGEQRLVTPGDYDVIRLLRVDDATGSIYLIASPDDATQRFLYRVAIDGGRAHRVTPEGCAGTHEYDIAPDGTLAVHRHSTFDRPPVAELVELPTHETIRDLSDNKRLNERLAKIAREPVEFLEIEIEEGVTLDGWCMRPPDFDPKKKYPVLVYVYGEPAGQTVRNRWGGSTHLWHRMLAQRGYVIVSFDNRGTPAPKGRAWRKSIHGRVGVLAPNDQAAALEKLLAERPWLDRDRTAIWGWSGGGSMSLHAVFQFPELYQAAMAVAPVANMRAYDTIYQERYMGLPRDNPQGYIDGSPITHAAKLRGDLLIVHGTGDDNCHYATTEQLIDELVRHDKPFSMMAYPNRTHSIRERAGTTVHLRALLTRFLLEHLEPGAKPREGE